MKVAATTPKGRHDAEARKEFTQAESVMWHRVETSCSRLRFGEEQQLLQEQVERKWMWRSVSRQLAAEAR
jgi:hypothetical protein